MEDANIHFLLIIHTISSDYKGKMQKLLERFSFKESSGGCPVGFEPTTFRTTI